jgi:hypothetical protein
VEQQLLGAEHDVSPVTHTGHRETATVAEWTARRRRRAGSVAIATLATSVIYLAASWAGVDFNLTDPGKTQPVHLSLPVISTVTLFFALLGWGALAALEHHRSRRAATVWRAMAVTVLLLSYAPIGIEHATASTKAMLVIVHTTVAVALLPMARRGRRAGQAYAG